MSPLYTKRPYFQKTSTGFFLETPIPYTSEALKKENVRKYLEGAAVDQVVFAIQLSILNRMSFVAGFAELGRPARQIDFNRSRHRRHHAGILSRENEV